MMTRRQYIPPAFEANALHRSGGYRLRRYYLVVGVIGVVGFSTMGIVSTVAALWNIDGSFPHPRLFALIFGVSWSAFTLLSVWLILAYFRENLILETTRITQHGIIRSRTVYVNDISYVKWRCMPQGGAIVLRTLTGKLKIRFDNFTTDERRELISALRDAFPPDRQEGWVRFEELQVQPQHRQKSRIAGAICALLLLAFAGVFARCWVAGMGTQWLVFGVANALTGLWYLWRICAFDEQASNKKSA